MSENESGDRVRVSEKREVEIVVDQEDITFESGGELVKIYIADEMAVLSRAEWDQIVGAL